MAPEIQTVNPLCSPDWDEQLASIPQRNSFFHTRAWATVLHTAYGYTPLYQVIRKEDRITDVLPMMEVKSFLTGRRGVSLPFSDYCEPLISSEEHGHALVQAALRLGQERKWKTVQFRAGETSIPGADPAATYVGHRLDLSVGVDNLLAQLKSTARTAIRKAEKADVHVHISGELEDLRTFYRLNGITRKRHGLPPQPIAFFEALQRYAFTPGRGFTVIGSHEGRAVAAAVFLRCGSQAIFKYGASDMRYQHLRANDLVMWHGIRRLAEQGCERLSLGKTRKENDGLRRFKRGLGAEEFTIKYFTYDVEQGTYVVSCDRVSGWHNRLFRHMPVPFSQIAGRLLYRHMG